MPAQQRISREKIIVTALETVKEKGFEAVNARSLAEKIGCSTQPIYRAFSGMEELKAALIEESVKVYENHVAKFTSRGEYPPYKAYGMGYISFAVNEGELFRLLFMRRRAESEKRIDFASIENVLGLISKKTGMSREEAYDFHAKVWMFVHGIAVSLTTGYIDLTEEQASELLTEAFDGFILEYRKRKENR